VPSLGYAVIDATAEPLFDMPIVSESSFGRSRSAHCA
jgi:hypothetical protein